MFASDRRTLRSSHPTTGDYTFGRLRALPIEVSPLLLPHAQSASGRAAGDPPPTPTCPLASPPA
jgi:hypothetical protein